MVLVISMADIKSLYGLGAKYKQELLMAIKELEEEHDREAAKWQEPDETMIEYLARRQKTNKSSNKKSRLAILGKVYSLPFGLH